MVRWLWYFILISVTAEMFIKTLKAKIYKKMIADDILSNLIVS